MFKSNQNKINTIFNYNSLTDNSRKHIVDTWINNNPIEMEYHYAEPIEQEQPQQPEQPIEPIEQEQPQQPEPEQPEQSQPEPEQSQQPPEQPEQPPEDDNFNLHELFQ